MRGSHAGARARAHPQVSEAKILPRAIGGRLLLFQRAFVCACVFNNEKLEGGHPFAWLAARPLLGGAHSLKQT